MFFYKQKADVLLSYNRILHSVSTLFANILIQSIRPRISTPHPYFPDKTDQGQNFTKPFHPLVVLSEGILKGSYFWLNSELVDGVIGVRAKRYGL